MANGPKTTPIPGGVAPGLSTPVLSFTPKTLNNFDLSGLSKLPTTANLAAIAYYLEELERSGATSAIIQYTEKGQTHDITLYCRDGIPTINQKIDIQSSTKAIFFLFINYVMGEEL